MFGGSPDSTGFLDIQWATLVLPTIEKWYWYCIQWATLVFILAKMGNLGVGIATNGQPWYWYWYYIQWATMGLVLVLHPMGILGFANNWENFHPRWIKREQNSNRKQNNTDNSIHINIQKDNFRSIKKTVNPGVCGCSSREPQLRSRCQPGQDGTRGYPQVAIMII